MNKEERSSSPGNMKGDITAPGSCTMQMSETGSLPYVHRSNPRASKFLRWLTALAAVHAALFSVACVHQVDSRAGVGSNAANHSDEGGQDVIRFLSDLYQISADDLLSRPQRIEEVMNFRVPGWRNAPEDNEYFLRLVRTPGGSFGGLAAFMPRSNHGTQPVLQFTPVQGSALKPPIDVMQVRRVFGDPVEVVPPSDFHRVSGGRLRYLLGKQRNVEVLFDIASSQNPIVSGIVVRRVKEQ